MSIIYSWFSSRARAHSLGLSVISSNEHLIGASCLMYCHYAGQNCICRFFNQFKHSLKFVHAETSKKGAYYIDGTLQVWKDDLDTSNTLAELLNTSCLECAFPPCHCCNDKKVIVLLRLSNNCEIILAEFALLWRFPPWRSSEIIHKQEKRIHIQAADNCGTPCVFCSASMAARKSRGSLGSITCQETGNFVNKLHGRSQVCSMCKSHLTDFWAQVPPSNESR